MNPPVPNPSATDTPTTGYTPPAPVVPSEPHLVTVEAAGKTVTADLRAVPPDQRDGVVAALRDIVAQSRTQAHAQFKADLVSDSWIGSAEAAAGLLTPHDEVFRKLREKR